MQHDLISTRYKLQIMRGRGIQNGKINWFVLNLMDKEILQLAMTQIDEKLPKHLAVGCYNSWFSLIHRWIVKIIVCRRWCVDTAWCWWVPGLVHAQGTRSHYLGVTDLCSPKFLRISKLKTAHHHLVSHFSPSPAWCHIIVSATAQHLHTHIFIHKVRCYMTSGNEGLRRFHNY